MVDFVEQANDSARTTEELLIEFVPQVFKCYFQIFLLKANQQFVEKQVATICREPTHFSFDSDKSRRLGRVQRK